MDADHAGDRREARASRDRPETRPGTFSSSPNGSRRSGSTSPRSGRPGDNPLFQYLKGLSTTVERIAAGLFTLESIAYAVNENFMTFCEQRGDAETVRIYREYIQPDERAHQQLGQRLLAKYATTPELQHARARPWPRCSRSPPPRARRPLSGWAPPASRGAEEVPP